jgi:hypothetical protein
MAFMFRCEVVGKKRAVRHLPYTTEGTLMASGWNRYLSTIDIPTEISQSKPKNELAAD